MADLLQTGVNWLADQREDYMSQSVTATRGTASATFDATFGSNIYEISDENGITVKAKADDFIVTASDYDFGAGPVAPQRGDTITALDGRIFQTLDLAGQPCYRPADPFGKSLRIHTKLIG